VLELTFNRDHTRGLIEAAMEAGLFDPDDDSLDMDFDNPDFVFGMPDEVITTRVDVTPWLDRKRRSAEAHASQVVDTGMFLAMSPEAFAGALGTEWYVRRGVPSSHRDDDVFAGVTAEATR
jgi:LmbE family N-acetylglucosaminyl deacetylase